jgi:hypothetical protein
MSYYRIKIVERNDGQKVYIPQHCKLEIKKRLFGQTQELVWYNIIYAYINTLGLSKTVHEEFCTEDVALKIIEEYKDNIQKEEDEKVKTITYKTVD